MLSDALSLLLAVWKLHQLTPQKVCWIELKDAKKKTQFPPPKDDDKVVVVLVVVPCTVSVTIPLVDVLSDFYSADSDAA